MTKHRQGWVQIVGQVRFWELHIIGGECRCSEEEEGAAAGSEEGGYVLCRTGAILAGVPIRRQIYVRLGPLHTLSVRPSDHIAEVMKIDCGHLTLFVEIKGLTNLPQKVFLLFLFISFIR